MNKIMMFAFLSMFSLVALASDHGMTKITGTNIDVSMKGHSFAGKVEDKLIYGRIHGSGHKYADVVIDDGHDSLKVQFANSKEFFGGVIVEGDKSTSLEFSHVINTEEETAIVLLINHVEHTIKIEAVDFVNGHFINPKFSTVIGGEEISFKVESGESCWMNSIQLVFSILGTYIH